MSVLQLRHIPDLVYVAKLVLAEEVGANYTQCYGRALSIACSTHRKGDMYHNNYYVYFMSIFSVPVAYRIVRNFRSTIYFHEFHEKIPIHENIIVNMLFPYISTVITYLVCEKLNAKILF